MPGTDVVSLASDRVIFGRILETFVYQELSGELAYRAGHDDPTPGHAEEVDPRRGLGAFDGFAALRDVRPARRD